MPSDDAAAALHVKSLAAFSDSPTRLLLSLEPFCFFNRLLTGRKGLAAGNDASILSQLLHFCFHSFDVKVGPTHEDEGRQPELDFPIWLEEADDQTQIS